MYELEFKEPEQEIVKFKRKYSFNEVFKFLFLISCPFLFTAFLISIEDVLPERENKMTALEIYEKQKKLKERKEKPKVKNSMFR